MKTIDTVIERRDTHPDGGFGYEPDPEERRPSRRVMRNMGKPFVIEEVKLEPVPYGGEEPAVKVGKRVIDRFMLDKPA